MTAWPSRRKTIRRFGIRRSSIMRIIPWTPPRSIDYTPQAHARWADVPTWRYQRMWTLRVVTRKKNTTSFRSSSIWYWIDFLVSDEKMVTYVHINNNQVFVSLLFIYHLMWKTPYYTGKLHLKRLMMRVKRRTKPRSCRQWPKHFDRSSFNRHPFVHVMVRKRTTDWSECVVFAINIHARFHWKAESGRRPSTPWPQRNVLRCGTNSITYSRRCGNWNKKIYSKKFTKQRTRNDVMKSTQTSYSGSRQKRECTTFDASTYV